MSSPFENPDATYYVLVNHEDQYSLWPDLVDVPAGWTIVLHDKRQLCVDYVNEHWVDMRPKSLINAMDK
jgi:MbtH protein